MSVLEELVEQVEGFEPLDQVSKPLAELAGRLTAPDAVKNLLSGVWLGHQLHPALTDVPIGAWTMATALDLTAGRSGAAAAQRLVGLGVLSALPAAASGASDWAETYGDEQRIGVAHALGNAAATGLQALSYLARRRGRRGTGVLLSTAALGLSAGAAYLGGHLSFVRGVGVNHTAYEEAVSDWTDVAAADDLAEDQPVRGNAAGVPVMVVRHRGELHALSATCVHAGGPLDEGEITGDCVRCPWHGSRFRLSDGSVERGPAPLGQPAWEVQVRDGRVLVRSAGAA